MRAKAVGVMVVFGLASLAHAGPDTVTYQGSLLNPLGGPVTNGTYQMQFKILDAATAGTNRWQETDNVQVTRGLFATTLGDNMPLGGLFTTYPDLWLEVTADVDRSGTFQADEVFSPRQNIAGVPWACPRLEPHNASPNLIGGFSGNWVTSGVIGATIAGGGEGGVDVNHVSDDHGTVSGGLRNTAGDDGGDFRDARNATVGGGLYNLAGARGATIAGGELNRAMQQYATAGGGYSNIAASSFAVIAGGYCNFTTDSSTAVIGGGEGNLTSGSPYATISGGRWNENGAWYSTIPGGLEAKTTHWGQMAHASGSFSAAGDAQFSLYTMRKKTPGATPQRLTMGGAVDRPLMVAEGRTLAFDILVVARSDAGQSGAATFMGVVENQGGTTSLIGPVVGALLGMDDPAWHASVVANDVEDTLDIVVTGVASTNIRWVAVVRTAEVAW